MTKRELKDQLADELLSRLQPDNGFTLTEFERQGVINNLLVDTIVDLQYQIQELNSLTGLSIFPPNSPIKHKE